MKNSLLIKNAELYAPERLGKKDILCVNGIIMKVDDSIDENTIPFETEVLDAGGRAVVPGLIDQHVHVTGGGGEKGFTSRVPEIKFSHIVESGVTTIVGLLGTDHYTRSVENLLAKTKALNEEGITAYCLTGSYAVPTITITGEVGKDIAYIEEIIGVKVAISDHRCSNPTKEELIRLASEVRIASLVSGKVGEVHMHTGIGKDGIKKVIEIIRETDIPAKHFRPTHMRKANEDDVVEFTKLGGYADYSSTETDPLGKAQEIMDVIEKGAVEDHITISSDSNGSLPKWNEKKELIGITYARMTSLYGEVKALMQKGYPLERAIRFITSNVADALEIGDRKGYIREGGDADIVILDSDNEVDHVIARGNLVVKDKNAVKKGFFED